VVTPVTVEIAGAAAKEPVADAAGYAFGLRRRSLRPAGLGGCLRRFRPEMVSWSLAKSLSTTETADCRMRSWMFIFDLIRE
jgi:hypothetical protein